MQKEHYLAFLLPTWCPFEHWNLSRHSKALILRALADEKALFRLAIHLLRKVSSSISAQGWDGKWNMHYYISCLCPNFACISALGLRGFAQKVFGNWNNLPPLVCSVVLPVGMLTIVGALIRGHGFLLGRFVPEPWSSMTPVPKKNNNKITAREAAW